jgi:uncharacterized protein (TIGR00303 family)
LQGEHFYSDIICLNERPSSPINKFCTTNPVFVCVISYTETSTIPGITIAGASPDLMKYTPPADSEFLYYGYCKCLDRVPITPDGKPTPAIITRSILNTADIPFFVVDAGSIIKPHVPCVSFDQQHGKNIAFGSAVDPSNIIKAFEYGNLLGAHLSKMSDLIVLGESVPGGTTTALGVLSALGASAEFKVSSSMPNNPHILKNSVVSQGLEKAGIKRGDLKNDPFKAVSVLGDPMLPSISGIAAGILNCGGKVMLAGGTQMTAVIAILNSLGQPLDNICIGTTVYVARDQTSDLVGLTESLSENVVPVYASNLHMEESKIAGLQAFSKGYVKDGVGAGGISIASILKSTGHINGKDLLNSVEKEYRRIVLG